MIGSVSIWWLILGLVATTVAVKAAGPVLLGGRELPPWATRVIGLMAPALLCALVVTAAFSHDGALRVGAHTVGVAAAGLLLWRGRSLILAVGVAMAVTALLRTLA